MSWFKNLSLDLLCVLGVSAVDLSVEKEFTAETPRTQRRRRDLKLGHYQIESTSLNNVNSYLGNVVITNSSLGNVNWLVTDQLGTPRMVFDQTGARANVKRHDYLPFGEEVYGGARNSAMGYGALDGVRQKFTQQERDNETGLDYMHARYFSSIGGRFNSADSFGGSIGNPQSLNRYAYVVNNPMNLSDPTGHRWESDHGVTSWLHHTEGSLMLGGQSENLIGELDYQNGTANWAAAEGGYEESSGDVSHAGADDAHADSGEETGIADSPQNTLLELGDSSEVSQAGSAPSFTPTYAQVPVTGTGYYRSGRPAVEWGDQRVVSELIGFARDWNRVHPDNDIGIGEMSNMYGQTVHPHHFHLLGLRVDIRPMRTDGAHQQVTWRDAAYSRDLTRELIQGLRSLRGYRSTLFNDPVLHVERLVSPHTGHDNHLHVTFRF